MLKNDNWRIGCCVYVAVFVIKRSLVIITSNEVYLPTSFFTVVEISDTESR